jgi:AcrR family transcriptional regulator
MAETKDRRIRKTRKCLQDALFSLMKEYSYQKIRISQITERADVSRSTFYLHYETKDDLLLSFLDEVIDKYFQAIDEYNSSSCETPSLLLFSMWKKNIGKIQLILDAGMEFRIYQRLRVFNLKRDIENESNNRLLNDYIRTMLDGASFALLLHWTQDKAKIPVPDMEQLFEGLNIESLFYSLREKLPNFGKP